MLNNSLDLDLDLDLDQVLNLLVIPIFNCLYFLEKFCYSYSIVILSFSPLGVGL